MAVHRLPSGSSIVKVETRNMTRTVHHHFDYEIDGHARTYRMHSTGPHNVWMEREADDSKIPYTVNGGKQSARPLHTSRPHPSLAFDCMDVSELR